MFDDPIVTLAIAVLGLALAWGVIEAIGMLADRRDRLEREAARRTAASPAADASPRPRHTEPGSVI